MLSAQSSVLSAQKDKTAQHFLSTEHSALSTSSALSTWIAHVTDFGLAKRMTADQNLTQSNDKLGTPAYMAPEQLKNARGVTTAVDIWALGIVLYESLAGTKPFTAEEPIALFKQIAEQEPVPSRTLDRDLETVVMKCLEKEPAKRYPSAGEVAAELRRWLQGEPIQARPVGQFERAWRWCKRNPAVSSLTATIAATLLVATIVSLGLAKWALGEKTRADGNAEQAEQNADRAESTLARSFLRPFDEAYWEQPESISVSQLQIGPLWELAENRGERIWFKTITEALENPRTTRQLVGHSQVLLHAAVGLDPAKREKLAVYLLARMRDPEWKDRHTDFALLLVSLGGLNETTAAEVGRQLLTALEREKYFDRLSSLVVCLEALAGRLDTDTAAALCRRGATRLVAIMEQEKDSDKLSDLAQGLGTLAGGLEPIAAAPFYRSGATRLVAVMEQEKNTYRLSTLAAALGALAGRLEPVAAAPFYRSGAIRLVASKDFGNSRQLMFRALETLMGQSESAAVAPFAIGLVDAIEQEKDSRDLAYLAEVLGMSAIRLEPAAAAPLLLKASARLLSAMEQEKDSSNLSSLAEALGKLAILLKSDVAAPLCLRGADLIVSALQRGAQWIEYMDFCFDTPLNTLATRLEPAIALPLASRLLAFMEQDSEKLYSFTDSLITLSSRLEPAVATPILQNAATQQLAAMEQEKDVYKLNNLTHALGKLAGRLEPTAAAPLLQKSATRLLAVLEQNKDSGYHSMLIKTLGTLEIRLEPANAGPLIARLVAAMEQEKDFSNLRHLIETLITLADRLKPAGAAPLLQNAQKIAVERLLTTIEQEENFGNLRGFNQALITFTCRLEPAIAEPLAVRLMSVMEQEKDSSRLCHLTQILSALVGRLEPAVAGSLSRSGGIRLMAVLEQEKVANKISWAAENLVELADRLEPAAQNHFIMQAIVAVSDDRMTLHKDKGEVFPSSEHLHSCLHRPTPTLLAQRLAARLNGIPAGFQPPFLDLVNLARAAEPFPARFSDAFMVELLQRPIGVGPWRRAILDALGTRHHQYFRDQWDYVRYAQEHKLGIDFTAGPKRQLPADLR